jgi:hypothetical protein
MAIIQVIPAGDLALSGGNPVLQSGPAHVRQKIASRFLWWLGEWFLDQRQGVPYYRDVFVKNPDLSVIRSVFRRVLLSTPGVLSVDEFDLIYEPADRTLAFAFHATVEGGVVIVTPDDRAFVLDIFS